MLVGLLEPKAETAKTNRDSDNNAVAAQHGITKHFTELTLAYNCSIPKNTAMHTNATTTNDTHEKANEKKHHSHTYTE